MSEGKGKGQAENHGKHTTIIVNTREKSVEGDEVTYQQLLDLAFDQIPEGENIEIVITYRNGKGDHKEGELFPGERVPVKNRMIFDVTPTDKS
jgi:hypothetical protein